MDLSFQSTERLAPFDQIHLFFKLITANCQPGTNRIKFIYKPEESDFSGMSHTVGGYHPIKTLSRTYTQTNILKNGDLIDEYKEELKVLPTINNKHSYANADITWDRLYISVAFRKSSFDDIITFYIIPYLLYNYMVIRSFEDNTEALLSVSSTLVIANVALLIVRQNNVFAYYEQSVLIQILVLIATTLVLSYYEFTVILQQGLLLFNLLVFVITSSYHYISASRLNQRVTDHIRKGDYHLINTI